jgi:hypothetical protein
MQNLIFAFYRYQKKPCGNPRGFFVVLLPLKNQQLFRPEIKVATFSNALLNQAMAIA